MARRPRPQMFKAEQIAYWFFRLNGCMNIVNFLVHHERRGREGTDVDILAMRFPYRQELAMSDEPMEDHPVFKSDKQIDIIIAEVKSGLCDLNGPWTDPDRQNMHRVLYAVGAFPVPKVDIVAEELYERQSYANKQFRVRLFALGQTKNSGLSDKVVQITWEEILAFIYERLRRYRRVKSQHHQWDWAGKVLYRTMVSCRSTESFVRSVLAQTGLHGD